MDPFSIEELQRGAEVIGTHCILLPAATYPIHVRGLGGRSVETVKEMIMDLNEAVERAEAHGLGSGRG